METLHAKVTNLSHILFNNCGFYTDDAVDVELLQPPAEDMVHFALDVTVPVQRIPDGIIQVQDQTVGNAIRSWISYIGMKYPQLESLYLNLCCTIKNILQWRIKT